MTKNLKTGKLPNNGPRTAFEITKVPPIDRVGIGGGEMPRNHFTPPGGFGLLGVLIGLEFHFSILHKVYIISFLIKNQLLINENRFIALQLLVNNYLTIYAHKKKVITQ